VVLVPTAVGIGVTTPAVLRVGDRLMHGGSAKAALHGATARIFAAALLVGLVIALGAAIESRAAFSEVSIRRMRRAVGAIAIATLVAVLAGGWVVAGDPLARVKHGWETFKGGYAADRPTGNRLTSGLGSGRYDFYRVALNEFVAHPLVGIGADNFQQQYLMHGRSHETPHYPHSVELRTLTQTGLAGALLALVGLGAALLAGGRAGLASIRSRADPLGGAVAAAALAGFAYWLVHGSFDWFWEFAGLGAPAFALLGLACALAPATGPPITGAHSPDGWVGGGSARVPAGIPTARRMASRRLAIIVGILVALAGAASLTGPWLSQLQVQSAARIWTTAPRRAYSDLDDAAGLNPLSDEAYLTAGTIALRFGDLARADHEFSLALRRSPGNAYATLERGAIASTRGDRTGALRLLERAVHLNPRDQPTREVLLLVRRGRRASIEELNRAILLKAQQLS
jgi:tetratricopeptide (TPR) repeat protein